MVRTLVLGLLLGLLAARGWDWLRGRLAGPQPLYERDEMKGGTYW